MNTVGTFFALNSKKSLEPYFQKRTVLYYRLRMPNYSNGFLELKSKDVKRWKNHATPLLIQFLPKWQNGNGQGATTQQSPLLKVEPKNRSTTTDTYKLTYELFKDGNVEDLTSVKLLQSADINKDLSRTNSTKNAS